MTKQEALDSTMIDDVVKACSEAEKLAIERAARIEALESEVKEQALQYISSFGQCKEHMERISALEKLAKEMAEAIAILRAKTDPKYGVPVADKALSRYREVCGCQ